MRHCNNILLSTLLLLLAGVASVCAADPGPAVEYRVKSAYVYNFTRFIEWPDNAQTAKNNGISICLLGKDPFGKTLDSIAGKVVRGHKLTIHRHKSIDKLHNCQVVFISKSEKARVGRILMDLRKRPILTISELKNFNQLGGIIQFNLVKKKVHFSINPDAARRAKLTISSKLLNLATIVRESRP